MRDIFSLTGKRIIVTGAASGIGYETAKLLQELISKNTYDGGGFCC